MEYPFLNLTTTPHCVHNDILIAILFLPDMTYRAFFKGAWYCNDTSWITVKYPALDELIKNICWHKKKGLQWKEEFVLECLSPRWIFVHLIALSSGERNLAPTGNQPPSYQIVCELASMHPIYHQLKAKLSISKQIIKIQIVGRIGVILVWGRGRLSWLPTNR